jgi:3,4-dihydroxy 2-butanone 4-phosphate synthase/GTP cyclohydrolase II
MTNNPAKIEGLRALGVRVVDRVPVEPTVHAENAEYLYTKAQRMNHLLTLAPRPEVVTLVGRRNGYGQPA